MMLLLRQLTWSTTVSYYRSCILGSFNVDMAVVIDLASDTLSGGQESCFLEFLSHNRLWVPLELVIVQMVRCIQVKSGTFHRYRCYEIRVGHDQLVRTLVAFKPGQFLKKNGGEYHRRHVLTIRQGNHDMFRVAFPCLCHCPQI